jgi:hypothetical protein
MKYTFFLLLLLLNLSANAQYRKAKVTIKIQPEFIKDFKDDEIHVDIWGDYKPDRYLFKNEISFTIDSIRKERVTVRIANFIIIDSLNVEKHFSACYNLFVPAADSSSEFILTYPELCIFNQSFKDKPCPKCKSRDMVIPISYGLQIPDFAQPVPVKPTYESYGGGCEPTGCDPTWYCKRDNEKF